MAGSGIMKAYLAAIPNPFEFGSAVFVPTGQSWGLGKI